MLESKYAIELANGETIEVSHVPMGCRLELSRHLFTINLTSIELGSFGLVVSMDWLARNQEESVCRDRVVRIPLPGGETLSV